MSVSPMCSFIGCPLSYLHAPFGYAPEQGTKNFMILKRSRKLSSWESTSRTVRSIVLSFVPLNLKLIVSLFRSPLRIISFHIHTHRNSRPLPTQEISTLETRLFFQPSFLLFMTRYCPPIPLSLRYLSMDALHPPAASTYAY